MIDPRREKWAPYVRKIADLMGLRDWVFRIHYIEPSHRDLEAECFIPEGRRLCNLFFSDNFLDNTPESQRETIVHELQHCHAAVFRSSVMKIVKSSEWKILCVSFEHSIDDTAVYVSQFMPLPKFKKSQK